MLGMMALEHNGLRLSEREVVVTGAAGGVGSIAVALLAARGYRVAASTGRPELHSWLRDLGATTIVDRAELAQKTPPLASERWGAPSTASAARAGYSAGDHSFLRLSRILWIGRRRRVADDCVPLHPA